MSSKLEQKIIRRLAENKKGKLIRVKCWTEENGMGLETYKESLIGAAAFIERHGCLHANWLIEFRSEPSQQVNDRKDGRTA